jgi:chromosome segregation ATPase
MTTEIFATWQAELDGEMQTAKQALADATVELSTAEEARDAARRTVQEQRSAFATVQQPLASAIAAKLRVAADELRQHEGAVARARGAVTNARRVMADLDEAHSQIRLVMAQHDPAEDPAVAEAATEIEEQPGIISPDIQRAARVHG